MGFMRWAWRHSATRQMLKPPPKPKRAMATVSGETHRLVWADRNAGWRFRCTCGWIDPKVRWAERNAINAGNAHVRSARTVVWRADVNAAVATALVKRASDAISAATTAMQREPNSSRAKREIDKAITACGKVRVAIARGQIVGDDARRVQEGLVAFGKAVETYTRVTQS